MAFRGLLWLAALVLIAASQVASATVVFSTITSPNAIERLPGPDGYLGTADDLVAPGANSDGSLSYIHFQGVSPYLGSEFHSFSNGSLTLHQPFEQVGSEFEVTDFSIQLTNRATSGLITTTVDLPNPPHRIFTSGITGSGAAYTLETCWGSLCFESDVEVQGFTLLRGVDPESYRGIDPTATDYLHGLVALAPPDWTAISLLRGEPTLMTEENMRGALAPLFIGGTASVLSLKLCY
jgi:hypothetical protein